MSPSRNVIGPLTTTFTPPPACRSCFHDDDQSGADSRLDYTWLCDACRTMPVCGRPDSPLLECIPSITIGLGTLDLISTELDDGLSTTAGFYCTPRCVRRARPR